MKHTLNADAIQTILVPTDLSKEAQNALLYAVEISSITKAEIVLFHAFHHPIFSPSPYNEDVKKLELEQAKLELLQAQTCKLLRNLCKDYSVEYSNSATSSSHLPYGFYTIKLKGNDAEKEAVTITCVCTFGLTTEEILKASNVYNADLIVMGMRGAGAISQALIGSTTIALINSSEVPVLAVPAHRKFDGLPSVVAAVNLAKLRDLQVLAPLRAIVKAFESKLHVLHLYKGSEQKKEQVLAPATLDALQANLQDINYEVKLKQAEEVTQGIREYVQEQQADLLVLLPGEHSFLNRLLSKPVTMQVAAKAFVPLLTLSNSSVNERNISEEATQERNSR